MQEKRDDNIIKDYGQRIATLEGFMKGRPAHEHNGYDSDMIEWKNIAHRRLFVHHTIYGADAATAANYHAFWIAPFACYVVSFKESHGTAGSDGSAVTIDLEKMVDGEAPGSGVSILSSALSLKATANTVQEGTITTTASNRTLAKNDRLGLKDTGTLTAVDNVSVLVELEML